MLKWVQAGLPLTVMASAHPFLHNRAQTMQGICTVIAMGHYEPVMSVPAVLADAYS